MKRKFDWRSRLHAVLGEFKAYDPAFLSKCVKAMTDEDDIATLEPIEPHRAQEGDVATMGDGAPGIVLGERVGVMTAEGYTTVPRSKMTKAFKVP